MSEEINLLKIRRGTISAPAGCGKTHLIAEALRNHADTKPVLILTHTNAGVAALKARLLRAKVSPKQFSISTIDGWCIKIVSTFPKKSGIKVDSLKLEAPNVDYPAIRKSTENLVGNGSIQDILSANYSSLIVDEYQDCLKEQHAIVKQLANLFPTCVLGDPLQSIFTFAGSTVDWVADVYNEFPLHAELATPWRWKWAGSDELGQWLLEVRNALISGKPIDLSAAPKSVRWVQLSGNSNVDFDLTLAAARTPPPNKGDQTLIIGDSKNADSRHTIASRVHGAHIVEPVVLKDLIDFSRVLNLADPNLLDRVARFAQSMMTNVGAQDLIARVEILQRGSAKKSPSDVEKAALALVKTPTFQKIGDLLESMSQDTAVKVYRPVVLRCCYQALQIVTSDPAKSFYEAAIAIRERNRAYGRSLTRIAVGSTLLVKGLEAESAIVLNADTLDAKNLYVAMTRGSKALVICSKNHILSPRK